jgi:transcriptional accessory protein Tex/SPT6
VWESFFATHRVGDQVHGKVLRTAQFGAFVEIAEGVEGLCHISEAGDDATKLETGMEHEFKIIKINVEEKKVGLSLRAVGPGSQPCTGGALQGRFAQASGLELYDDAWRFDQLEEGRAEIGSACGCRDGGHPSGWPLLLVDGRWWRDRG